jgi:hypothetical protein
MADPESHRIRPGLTGDARGVTPAVGKTLEIGLVVLYVALVTTVLLAGVVPEYRAAAGAEVGDRVLVAASQDVERAVPPDGTDTTVERTVQLPATIAGTGYRIRADGRRLVLEHPDAAVGGAVRLVLGARVDRVTGTWESGAETIVRVTDDSDGLVVELAEREGSG